MLHINTSFQIDGQTINRTFRHRQTIGAVRKSQTLFAIVKLPEIHPKIKFKAMLAITGKQGKLYLVRAPRNHTKVTIPGLNPLIGMGQ